MWLVETRLFPTRPYHGGQYYDKETKPNAGLAIARMLGHITYLSREAMMTKFDADRLQTRDIANDFETKFSVGSYLAYQGDRFWRTVRRK